MNQEKNTPDAIESTPEYFQRLAEVEGLEGIEASEKDDKTKPMSTDESIEALVKKHAKDIKFDDNNKMILPEGLEPWEKTVLIAEKRRRDQQRDYQNVKGKLTATTAEVEALKKEISGMTIEDDLTSEEQKELDDLKFTDPDMWFEKKQELQKQLETKKKDKLEEVTSAASLEATIEERAQLLLAHNEANPDFQITQEVLENDVPPRFLKALEGGQPFDEFIDDVLQFLQKPKKLKDEKLQGEVDLGKLTGGQTPAKGEKRTEEEIYADLALSTDLI